MNVSVYFHGDIRESAPEVITLRAATYRILLNGLKQIPGLNPLKNPKRYLCTIAGVKTVADLDKPLDTNEVHIHCLGASHKKDIVGSGNNPYVRMVIGVILIAIGLYFYSTGSEFAGSIFVSMGLSLIFGGLIQLLTPAPEAEEPEKNKSLTGYENTVKSGTPIPLILGEHLHGGHIISINVETLEGKDFKIADFVYNHNALASSSWVLLSDGTNGENIDHPPVGDGVTMPPDGMPPEDVPPANLP